MSSRRKTGESSPQLADHVVSRIERVRRVGIALGGGGIAAGMGDQPPEGAQRRIPRPHPHPTVGHRRRIVESSQRKRSGAEVEENQTIVRLQRGRRATASRTPRLASRRRKLARPRLTSAGTKAGSRASRPLSSASARGRSPSRSMRTLASPFSAAARRGIERHRAGERPPGARSGRAPRGRPSRAGRRRGPSRASCAALSCQSRTGSRHTSTRAAGPGHQQREQQDEATPARRACRPWPATRAPATSSRGSVDGR